MSPGSFSGPASVRSGRPGGVLVGGHYGATDAGPSPIGWVRRLLVRGAPKDRFKLEPVLQGNAAEHAGQPGNSKHRRAAP